MSNRCCPNEIKRSVMRYDFKIFNYYLVVSILENHATSHLFYPKLTTLLPTDPPYQLRIACSVDIDQEKGKFLQSSDQIIVAVLYGSCNVIGICNMDAIHCSYYHRATVVE
jgi:hypothetical protein